MIPHILNKEMIELYTKSDAFIYELLVASLQKDKIQKDRFIKGFIQKTFNNKKLKILCYGDGIGTDSQLCAELNHDTTYFDIEGLTSDFARMRLKNLNILNKIKFVHNEKNFNTKYDVIICREVLEHLENPMMAICNFRKLLGDNGLLILSESFSRVTAQFPTHLKSNMRYSGKTIDITVDKGFVFLERYNQSNLYIFQKTNKNNVQRYKSIPKISFQYKLKKRIRKIVNYYLR